VERINKCKSWFFEMANKIEKKILVSPITQNEERDRERVRLE
jgi:hypothetical protein